jgi:hypothetical protein
LFFKFRIALDRAKQNDVNPMAKASTKELTMSLYHLQRPGRGHLGQPAFS